MAYTTIDDPSAHFQTAIYTGNGSANLAITNDGNSDLQPDFVWIKNRAATDSHCWFDSSRGATELLSSDATTAETTDTDTLDSFASDGFQVDADVKVNTNTETYVAWQWKCNGGTETTSSTEGGSALTSSAQANTTAKFSIVTYTGSGSSGHTFVHGLGSVPKWIILKSRSDADVWHTFHQDAYRSGSYNQWQTITKLNLTNASDHGANSAWSNTAASSTLVTVGIGDPCNEDGDNFVAYCWDEVQGFSKFGYYVGNGDADGPFNYLGFKPAWLMIRRSDSAEGWHIVDHKRDINENNTRLQAESTGADDTSEGGLDMLSNGFKIRTTWAGFNDSGGEYIYVAFAEHPFVTSGGIPCTAR